MSLKSPLSLVSLPRELHLNILTHLRATDLSALQQTSRCFNNRDLIAEVIEIYAHVVYPSDLTTGFDTPIVSGEVTSVAVAVKKGTKKTNCEQAAAPTSTVITHAQKVYTYEMLRNMEMLVVARVLSRPEPPVHERTSCFYVSKSWCRAALRWLEVQEEERKEQEERRRAAHEAKLAIFATPKSGKGAHGKGHGSSGKKKLSRKEQKQRDRRMSDSMPPWSNINDDIVCEHGSLKQCSSKSARARRRVMDKQAWKVLRKLFPDSVQLEGSAVCLMCAAEAETAKKAECDKKEEEKADRKKPLSCPLVRGFYTRGSKGYPIHCVVPSKQSRFAELDATLCCPLVPGVYCALPRSWCFRWRRYIKTGEGGFPPPPDGSEVLCEAHDLPLIPPHLESFLLGETPTLFAVQCAPNAEHSIASIPVGASAASSSASRSLTDAATFQALRAAGLSESEVHLQRVAMARLEENMQRAHMHHIHQPMEDGESMAVQQQDRNLANEQLDRENRVVLEILTDDEITALEGCWPRCHFGTYALRFAIVEDSSACCGTEIHWSTAPCRECDPSSRSMTKVVVRNRLQKRGYTGL